MKSNFSDWIPFTASIHSRSSTDPPYGWVDDLFSQEILLQIDDSRQIQLQVLPVAHPQPPEPGIESATQADDQSILII